MRATSVFVQNYKALRHTGTALSEFSCVVGENNVGKSSLLQALLLFCKGTKLKPEDYYDPDADILIRVTFDNVTEDSLAAMEQSHRDKLLPLLRRDKLVLIRRYSAETRSSKLLVQKKAPKDKRLRDESVNDAFKGLRGDDVDKQLRALYPEAVHGFEESVKTQTAAKELIQVYVDGLEDEELVDVDSPLPTGIDNSISAILPEPVYIPAVKDLSDDLKTKDSATFGKLLSVLLNVIDEDLQAATEVFEDLRKKLNRVTNEDGSVSDDRIERVRQIEQHIQSNVRESFRDVSIELEIPPPEIKTVLSGARVFADDGTRGDIESKGDGFKRAVTFSILRSYVQLSQSPEWQRDRENARNHESRFLFLFEEPELYLHPAAQNILFDALALISEKHQVIVSTHSPLFFSTDCTRTFIRMRRQDGDPKPSATCHSVSLNEMAERDRFQIISFETSNMAFFSNHIVLVEGDSELIALPHIAKLLDTTWDFRGTSTDLVQAKGKGSFSRYKSFFSRFDTRVSILCDLDVLVDGFGKLQVSQECVDLRSRLIQMIDQVIEAEALKDTPDQRLLKKELKTRRARDLRKAIADARADGDHGRVAEAVETFFDYEWTDPRLMLLRDHARQDILQAKRDLLAALRQEDVYVLEKGAIEDYYPDGVTGPDKPSKAQDFCKRVTNRDMALRLSEKIAEGDDAPVELCEVFRGIFSRAPAQ